jgi:hypothetical protein
LFAQVDTTWVRRYNAPGNGADYARALAVDGSGNVFVTGNSATNLTWPNDYDYVTIKYSPAGDELWVKRYIGPGAAENNDDYALALAVDGSGNVYVTGHSPGSGTGDDIATIKYSPAGDELWVRRYNGEDNDVDCGNAIAVDDAGNVYVTGYSYDAVTSDNYLTIKYNTDGDEQWVIKYDGPGNGGDYANAISVDDTGNVYIAGSSFGGWDPDGMEDYATIKYSQAGGIADEPGIECVTAFGFAPIMPTMTNGDVQITYVTTMPGNVVLKVYDAMGRLVQTLVNTHQPAGDKSLIWNNDGASNGVYFFKLAAENKTATCKLILVR